jgi:hypothetical protein
MSKLKSVTFSVLANFEVKKKVFEPATVPFMALAGVRNPPTFLCEFFSS